MKKRFNLWIEEDELLKLKEKAKKERRSINGFVLTKVFEDDKKSKKKNKG